MYVVKKSHHNPIFSHKKENSFEAHAAFNMSVIKVGKYTYGLYRGESEKDPTRQPERISSIGITRSLNGKHFDDRKIFIEPSEDWDKCGCEDPRVTFFEGKYYIFYTALSGFPFNADNIKVAVAVSKDLKKIDKKFLVTPFNAKAMMLFPKRINGKVTVALSANTDRDNMQMAIASVDNIEDLWNEKSKKFWDNWYKNLNKNSLDISRDKFDFYEGGAVPIYTKFGWVFIYSHIQNYKSGAPFDRIFGIEALILDKNNPQKIIARTKGPLIVPSEEYEVLGRIENICFPSGAILDGDRLMIYYGVVDAKTCVAYVSLTDLLGTILPITKEKWAFKRLSDKPILSPTKNNFETFATFNPASILLDGKVYIIYRAMSADNTSTMGLAISRDGVKIDERLTKPIYVPRMDFELKRNPGGNSGCEDPRVVLIGGYIYMFYTAYNGVDKPRVAVTKISKKNFLLRDWDKWDEPFIISPDGFDDKDTCVFPEKIDSKYFVLHRIGIEMTGDYIKDLDFEFEKLDKCISIMGPRVNTWDNLKVGIATPPIKTKFGWLVLYHGISKTHHTYRMGAALLDLEDPTFLISRTADPIFEPELVWEKEGIVNNVVFPCGACVIGKYLYIYYGGADKYVGVARIELFLLLKALTR